MDKKMMQFLFDLLNYEKEKLPFMPMELRLLESEICDILNNYCFKHGIRKSRFRESSGCVVIICRECNAKEHKKYVKKYGEDDGKN